MESGTAEILLRLLADAELAHALARCQGELPPVEGARAGQPTARAQLAAAAEVAASLGGGLPAGEVTRLAAGALTMAGAIDGASAAAVVGDLDSALGAWGLPVAGSGLGPGARDWPLPAAGPVARGALSQAVAGPVRVARVMATLPVEVAGQRAQLELLACTLAPVGALFAGATRLGQFRGEEQLPLLHLDAVDDQGRRCQLTFEALPAGDALWEGWLSPAPAPGAGLRWLEVATGAGRAPARVHLDVPAMHPRLRAEPVAARGTAEQLAEAAAADLLAAALMPVPWPGAAAAATTEALGIGSVITVLRALGLLPAHSPALRHLAAVGERLGAGFPIPASGLAKPASLPEPFEAVLADRGRRDGPPAVTRVAVTLPPLDGTRIALTALESAPDRALLHMLAIGWDPPATLGLRAFTGAGQPPLSWWARDSTGRWHTASGGSWNHRGDRHWTGTLQLRPPLHPAATSLELTITGASQRLRLNLPLHWHAQGPTQPSG